MELDPNPVLIAAIKDLESRGKHSAEILRYLAGRGLTPMEMMIQMQRAFDLPWSDVSPIQGWWLDVGELTDDAINVMLDPTIARSTASTRSEFLSPLSRD